MNPIHINSNEDVITSKVIKEIELRKKLAYILRSEWNDNTVWCGCYEGDIREFYELRRHQAVDDLMDLIKELIK